MAWLEDKNINGVLLVLGVILFALGVIGSIAGLGFTISSMDRLHRIVLGELGVVFILASLANLNLFPKPFQKTGILLVAILLSVGLIVAVYCSPASYALPLSTSIGVSEDDPTIIDNFNNPDNDGSFDQNLWIPITNPPNKVSQESGVIVFTKDEKQGSCGNKGAAVGTTELVSRKYEQVTISELTANVPTFLEAKLLLDPEKHAGNVHLKLLADLETGEQWYAECRLADRGLAACFDWLYGEESKYYEVGLKDIRLGSWHIVRIEIIPYTMTFTYYIDDHIVGTHIPVDAELLRSAKFSLIIGIWGDTNKPLTGYIDDVRIGMASSY